MATQCPILRRKGGVVYKFIKSPTSRIETNRRITPAEVLRASGVRRFAIQRPITTPKILVEIKATDAPKNTTQGD